MLSEAVGHQGMGGKTLPLYLNPAAGRGQAGKHAQSIVALFAARGICIKLQKSAASGDLERQVFQAAVDGVKELIVAGGDGSIHEVVNGVLRANADTAIGVVPVGTGNDFAKSVQASGDWREATSALARRICSGAPHRKIDAGKMNGRYFANGAGIGLDAKINNIAKAYRWPRGKLVYLFATFRGILDGTITPAVQIRYDAVTFEGPIVLANISNGPWVGGLFHIAPMAHNRDSRFELILAEPMSKRRLLSLLPKLIRGQHISEPEITHASISVFSLHSNAPLASQLDGESQPMQTEFTINLLPDALSIL